MLYIILPILTVVMLLAAAAIVFLLTHDMQWVCLKHGKAIPWNMEKDRCDWCAMCAYCGDPEDHDGVLCPVYVQDQKEA